MLDIAPSILAADFTKLGQQVSDALATGVKRIHVDVMDGRFVPNLTIGPLVVEAVRRVTELPLDVHLMIVEPEKYIEAFVEAGADLVSVHVETCPHLHQTIAQIHELGMTAGVTLNPATPVAALHEAARYADLLLCMSVNPGWGGQRFIEASVERLGALRQLLRPGMGLEVDGGVGPATIERCHAAGANVMVAGSAIYDDPSPGDAWKALAALVGA